LQHQRPPGKRSTRLVALLMPALAGLGAVGLASATHSPAHPIQLRFRHLEPLCLADPVGPPCAADTRLDKFPGFTGIAGFDYGSASGTVRSYSGPGWRATGGLPDGVDAGSYLGETDLLCDGVPDRLASRYSAPPAYAPYPLVLHADIDGDTVPHEPVDDLQRWLLPYLPPVGLYPAHSRTRAVIDYAWVGGQEGYALDEPYQLDTLLQRVPWSPTDPSTGQGTLLVSLVLHGGDQPTPLPCMQSLSSSVAPFFSYVDVDGDNAPETAAFGNPPLAGDSKFDSVDDKAGYYLRWSVATATDPAQWLRDQPFANDYRGRRLDVAVVVRCYYLDKDGVTPPPAGSDDDRDCLEDETTAQPGRPADVDDATADRDGDVLLDGLELAWGSSPTAADADADSLSDALELALLTNPGSNDSDGDGRGDPVDNCPLLAGADQADLDNDGWLLAHTVFRRGVVGPALAPSSTDVFATPLADTADITIGPLLLASHSFDAAAGGDACDGDADGDLLSDAVECQKGPGVPPACQKVDQAVALALADEDPFADRGSPTGGPPDGDPGNDLQDAGIRCVRADQNGDTVPELPPAAVFERQADSDGDTFPDGLECLLGSAPGSGSLTNTFPPGGSTPISGAGSTVECASPAADDDADGRTDDCADLDGDGLPDTAERAFRATCLRVDPGGGLTTACDPALAQQDLDGDTTPDIDSDADDDGLSGRSDGDSDGDTRTDLVELQEPSPASPVQQDSDGDGCRDGFEAARAAGGQGDPSRPRLASDLFDNNRDRVVTIGDIGRVVANFGRNLAAGNYASNFYDPNLDGSVTIGDISRTVVQFGITCLN